MSAPHQAQIQGGFCHGGYDLQTEIRLINVIASREIIQKSISKNLTKSNQKSPKKKSASKRFSTKEISKNPQNFNKINLNKIKPRAKSIFVNNKNDSSLSNQNKESENTFKNQNDSLDINKELNLENKDSKYINDFLSNKVSSKLSYQDDNLIHNSSYNFESQMFDSKNNLNLNITKKTRRRTLKSYKLNELKDDEFAEEDEEDNEETENKSDTNDIYDKEKDKSFSWIKKLNEIAKNEVTKEIGSFNKKRLGILLLDLKLKGEKIVVILMKLINNFQKIQMKINYIC